nr:uncharacterized protein LOC123768708 [Procambarus clarkii]
MELVAGGRYAFITTKFQNDYIVASRYTDRFGHCTIHISSRSYPKSAGTSWGFRKGAPFRRRITVMTQWMIEAGLIDHWLPDVITTRVIQERSIYPDELLARPAEVEEELVPLNLEHLKGAFLLLGLCYGLASLVLLGEMFLARHALRCITTSQHGS